MWVEEKRKSTQENLRTNEFEKNLKIFRPELGIAAISKGGGALTWRRVVQKSHTDFDDFDDGDDEFIEELLASEDREDRDLGLYYINESKGGSFCGLLQTQCSRIGRRLQSADIADIWQHTMFDIWVNVEEGRYEKTGALCGYVYTIFTRRAVDFFRKRRVRIATNRDVEVDLAAVASCDEHDETPRIEFEWSLLDYIKALSKHQELSKSEKLVIEHYVVLLLANNNFPSPAELATAVNIERVSNNETKLSVEAVKSTKARAIKKLRERKHNGDKE